LAEVAVKLDKHNNVIQFPANRVSEVTLSTAQLEDIIQRAVEAAKARPATLHQTTTDSLYKSNGQRKPSAAQPLRTSVEYHEMCDYLLNHGHKNNRVRNYVLLALGCSLGLRISDLLKLTVDMCFDKSGNIKKRIPIVEKKTHKKNNYVIVTSVGESALKKWWLEYRTGKYQYIFFSDEPDKSMTSNCAWRIINGAAQACGLQGSYGTHTLRKTFGYQAFTAAQKTGMGGQALELLQTKYNHSDQRVTMRYAGIADAQIEFMAEAASHQLEGDLK